MARSYATARSMAAQRFACTARTAATARTWGSGAAWDLKSIPSLVAEYWSDLGVTIGTGVSAWADQSGRSGVPLVQGTGANQPAYEAAGWVDGGPSILFDGASSYLTGDGLVAYLTGDDAPHSVIILAELVTLGNFKYILNAAGAGSSEIRLFIHDGTSEYRSARYDDVGGGATAAGTTLTGGRHTISAVFTGTAISVFVDGGTIINSAAHDVSALALTSLWLGCYKGLAPYHINARFAHMSVYSTALSAADRAMAEAYVIARRGV